ncbi:caspase b-like isoform X2 [Puntigrus tetrazona]|uniref:caspase b-like isoform X2 n=1 Tax=Puntigrus tetrazona TaxID=1606681 RepID=UPI001C8A0529|nr:caspase b-like isoform X2 [Puntigrus tetrazona]
MEDASILLKALKDLEKEDLEEFKWHLCTGLADDIERFPKGDLEGADRKAVVSLMVNRYDTDAGKITVQVLRKMSQNNLAKSLELKLLEGQQDTRKASMPVESQSDGKQRKMIQSSQEFKRKILQEKGDEIYRPATVQRKRPALLITNIEFEGMPNRKGAEIDEENMEWLLKALGYNVEKRRNLSGEEIDREVRNFSELLSEHRDLDSTFVVIMSHGGRINNRDVILGVKHHYTSEDIFFVEDIFSHLNSVNCPALIDKPKVILIQASRSQLEGEKVREQVSEKDSWFHKEKDFVCFMSSIPRILKLDVTLSVA